LVNFQAYTVKSILITVNLIDCIIILHNYLELFNDIWKEQNDDNNNNFNDNNNSDKLNKEELKKTEKIKKSRL